MKAWSFLSVSFVSLALSVGCGSKSDDKDEAASTTTSYTYVANTKAIIDANCSGSTCHSTGTTDSIPFANLTQVKAKKATILTRLQSTDATLRMPKDVTGFLDTEDGQILLEWIQLGSDLK